MNKIFIVLLFILLGSSLIVINNIKGNTENSFIVEYQNNKNLAMPDLTGKTEIFTGVYRLYDDNDITIDYNVYFGEYVINGTNTAVSIAIIFNIETNTQYYISYYAVSGSLIGGGISLYITSPTQDVIIQTNQNVDKSNTFVTTTQNTFRVYINSGRTFDNYTFKLQLEKGSRATSYIVPRIYPIYKDNLTQEEKQQIGMGAFEGIPQIIRTINNILKPVTDFVNGILSIFS